MLLLVIFGGAGLLICGLGVPLLLRRVPPNSVYGLRTVSTLKSESLWYEANMRSGFYSVVAGGIIVLVSLAVYLLGLSKEVAGAIDISALLVGVSAMCIKSAHFAKSLEQTASATGEDV